MLLKALILFLLADVTLGAINNETVTFFLHTQENPEEPQILQINDSSSVLSSNFTPVRPTMVLIHGFLESSDYEPIVNLWKAYVAKYDHNVIVVNYDGYKPSDGDIYLFYQDVGDYVHELVLFLIENFGLKPADTHIIGHSVGCHVAGRTGKVLREKGLQVKRVTGLDPANWSDLGETTMDILRPGAAEIVDCIHTSTTFGIHTPICKCNFYPNGGAKQPECKNANEIGQLIGLCDHLSSFRYFQRTFEEPNLYPSYKCDILEGNTLKNCTTILSAFMGMNEDKDCSDGIYNVPIYVVPN